MRAIVTLREKLLYQQLHPIKLGADAAALFIAAVLLWEQHLLRALVVAAALPLGASLVMLSSTAEETWARLRSGQHERLAVTAAIVCIRVAAMFAIWAGAWYYWYPGGQCFNGSLAPVFGFDCLANGYLPINGNVIKKDLSFYEGYAKATYTVNDQVAFGAAVFYSPSVLNSGAPGTYASGGAKFTAPSNAMPAGWGLFLSGEAGHWFLGSSDNFYCTQVGVAACTLPFPNGIPYRSYTTWNVGIGITKSVFTLDFRYYDTDLNKGDCNAFTSDHTARFSGDFTSINPGGFGSTWCGASFVVTGKFDLTAMANLK